MKLADLFLNRFLYRDNNQNSETKDASFVSADSSSAEPAPIYSGGAAQDINSGNVLIDGGQLEPGTIPTTVLDVSNWGWGQTCAFSSTDLDTVSWGAGTFTSASGESYSISAGNTGNMAGKTYIYLSLLDSETAYQTTTTPSEAVGIGKVLVAVANPDTTSATYNLSEATQIVGDNILANSINASKITTGQLIVGTNVGLGTAAQVFNSEPTTPYYIGDLWSAGASGDLKRCIIERLTGAYVAADWELASKYTDNTVANQALSDAATAQSTANTAQTTADNKIESYYQATAPHADYINVADNPTYNTYVGDMWYDTTSNVTYLYTKTANGGNFDYEFIATTIPNSVFDVIDGKNTIFTATPTVPYYVGDMWITSLTASTGDFKKCITQRTTGSYTASEWVIATNYDNTQAQLDLGASIDNAKANGTTLITGGYISTGIITASNIQTGTLSSLLIQTSTSANTGIKMSSAIGGMDVYNETIDFYYWSGAVKTQYGTMGSVNGYFAISTISNRNLRIKTDSGTTFFDVSSGAGIAPLTSGQGNCGLSSQYWANVYSNNYNLSTGTINYQNGSISVNDDFAPTNARSYNCGSSSYMWNNVYCDAVQISKSGYTTKYITMNTSNNMEMNTGLYVGGTLSKSAGSFTIDHPLKPDTHFLQHSFVESPDMLNIYRGNANIVNGECVIEMPDWFSPLNGEIRNDYSYQLTSIGQQNDLWVKTEMKNGIVVFAGEKDGKFSYIITAVRHDDYAENNRILVELEKDVEKKQQYKDKIKLQENKQ